MPSDTPTAAPKTQLIALETTPCRGFCPVFRLDFRNDGYVDYEGIRFVRKMGKSSFQLTEKELTALQQLLKTTNLWQYPESFPVTIVDAPGALITVHRDTETKTIRGSVERPEPIRKVEAHLKTLAEAHGYNLESLDPNAIPDGAPTTELLVKLKPAVNAGNWLRDINDGSKTNLRLVRRVSSDNIWLVAFDSGQFKKEDVLLLVKSNSDVLEAQYNKEAQERKQD